MTKLNKTHDPETKLRRVCIIGWPVAHSRSPLIHNYWINLYGIAHAHYERLAVPPEKLGDFIMHLDANGFVGANITVPHKEAAFAALRRHDAVAAQLKAVNTIVTTPYGLEGRNTDGYGFIANLHERAPDWHPEAGPAVLLGAGGAARAIAAALAYEGVREIRIVNRTRTRAASLLSDLAIANVQIYDWTDYPSAFTGAALLVNTTALGMKGEADIDLPLDVLPLQAVVSDIVYAPLETTLLKRARMHGHVVVDGLGMLLHQAVPGFEAWFGLRAEVTSELRRLVLADLGIAAKEG